MVREYIVAPGIYAPSSGAHAVKAGNVVYTSGTLPLDSSGKLVGRGDIGAQARQIYENLDAVLRASGASWNDVAKYNAYLLRPEERQTAREVHYEYMPLYQRAGAMVILGSEDPEVRLQAEVIAHIRTPKHCVTNVPDVFVPLGSPHAVKVGERIYVTGQQAIEGQQPTLRRGEVGKAAVHERHVVGRADIAAQTEFVYRNFDAVLRAAGAGWDDVVNAHAYLTSETLMDATRPIRRRYLPAGRVSTTSVVAGLVGSDWLIESELIAFLGEKQAFIAPDVYHSDPVVAHAVRAGNTIYVQGLVAWDREGNVVGGDDGVRQAQQVYQNLDVVLRSARATWSDVVHVKSYFKRHTDVAAARQARSQFLKRGHYASTEVIAGFFKPQYLLEVELVAVTGR